MAATLVLANREDDDPGLVGDRLAEHGHELVVATRESADPWPDPRSFDLVVLLGSEWSVYDPAQREPVAREAALARDALAADVPLLGICFGAQLLAHALGGSVAPGAGVELGWLPVEPTDGTLEAGPWFQWHGDVFTPPPDARVLATSPMGCQAFALGSALAVQFHPEATPGIVARWAASDPGPLAAAGRSADEIVARTAAEQDRVVLATTRLVDHFLYGEAGSGGTP